MTRALVAVFKSTLRAEIVRCKLSDAEVLGAVLDLAVDHHSRAGIDADQLRFELDKKLLERAVATMGRAG
jgi:hypothetical protein